MRSIFVYSCCLKNGGENVMAECCSEDEVVETLSYYVRIEGTYICRYVIIHGVNCVIDETRKVTVSENTSILSGRRLKRQRRMGAAYLEPNLQSLPMVSTSVTTTATTTTTPISPATITTSITIYII